MQINLDNVHVCVINLKERTERLKRTMEELKEFFRCNRYQQIHVIDAIKHRRPMIGIAESHMLAVALAKEYNWPYVIIVEDDVRFQSKRSKEHADNCLANVPDDFEVLLGGIYTGKLLKTQNEYWSEVHEFSALHFYLVKASAYDRLLSFDKTQHIDRWIGNKQKGNLKCYVANEFFAIQYDGYSDNVGMEMKYSDLLIQNKYKLLK